MHAKPGRTAVRRTLLVTVLTVLMLGMIPAISTAGASAFADPSVPAEPWNIHATAGASPTITLSWSAPFDGGSPVTDYVIEYSTDDQTWTRFDDGVSNSTTATMTGLTGGTTYHLRVAARNSAGTGRFGYAGGAQLSLTGRKACASSSIGVQCWGYTHGGYYQWLQATPVPAVDGAQIRKVVSAGDNALCALSNSGLVSCWGSGEQGVLGNGVGYYSEIPAPRFDRTSGAYQSGTVAIGLDNSVYPPIGVPLSGVVDIASTWSNIGSVCALRDDGAVFCWGRGIGGTATRRNDLATPITRLANNGCFITSAKHAICAGSPWGAVDHEFDDVVQISSDSYYWHRLTCAVITDGSVRCKGPNDGGQLGDGTTTGRPDGASVVGISNAIDIASTLTTACALLADRTVKCWGTTSSGELGDGRVTSTSTTPVEVANLTDVTQLAAGFGFYCATSGDGSIMCWGRFAWMDGNGSGQTYAQPTPVTIYTSLNATDSVTLAAPAPTIGSVSAPARRQVLINWSTLTPSVGRVLWYRALVFQTGTSTKVATCWGASTDQSCTANRREIANSTTYDVSIKAVLGLGGHVHRSTLLSSPIQITSHG